MLESLDIHALANVVGGDGSNTDQPDGPMTLEQIRRWPLGTTGSGDVANPSPAVPSSTDHTHGQASNALPGNDARIRCFCATPQ